MYTIIDDVPNQEPVVRFESDHRTSVMTLDQIMGMAFRYGLEFHDIESMICAFDKKFMEMEEPDDPKKGNCVWVGMNCTPMEFIKRFEEQHCGEFL